MRLPIHLIDFRHRPPQRLAAGITISLLLHGLILSLQFGELGLALPGVELPWNERRAPTPELTVRFTYALPQPLAPTTAITDLNPIQPAPVRPVDPLENKVRESATAVPPAPREKQPAVGLVLLPAPRPVSAPPAKEHLKIALKKPKVKRKTVTLSKPAVSPKQAVKEQAEVRPPIIANTTSSVDTFVVNTPSPDDPQPPTSSKASIDEPIAEITPPEEPITALAIDDTQVAAKQNADAERERDAEKERQAQRAQAVEQHRKAEQDALAKLAEGDLKKREQDEAARPAIELEAKQREEIKQQLEAKTTREALEREALKLDEQKLADTKHLQAIEANRLKQAQEIAAIASAQAEANQQKAAAEAAATAARKQAEATAAADAQQKESARIAGEKSTAAAAAANATAAANAAAARGNETRSLERGSLAGIPGSGDLTSRALSQARNLDLFNVKPSPSTASSSALPSAREPSRRRSIFGSKDRDIGLRMYIDNWRLKIERNGRLNYAQSSIAKSRGDPVVTVAVRSDGSVEDITINRSSGRPELDEAVRRIVKLNARFSAFPPSLASQYDVIEIHHVWNFDETLRLLDEVQ